MKSAAIKLTCVLVVVLVVISASYRAETHPGNKSELATFQDDLKKLCQCVDKFGPPAPELNPTVLPVDVSLEDNLKCKYKDECLNSPTGCCQPCFDCFGWQLFIAMNWPAKSTGEPDPTKPFGMPGDIDNVVWQTYKNALDVFGDTQPTWSNDNEYKLKLNSAVLPGTFLEADLQSDNNWLTDQDGQVVRYEIRMNADEFHYIVKNDLWHQEGIYNFVKNGPGITLPSKESEYGKVGAIEIKAAWRIIPDNRRDYFKENYKTTRAEIYDSVTGESMVRDVALVGLHIIKKTPNSPQWVWATFEHKDNVPVEGDSGKGRTWNFFNPDAPSDYRPNWEHPPYGLTQRSTPVQVIRIKQPNGDDADSKIINDAMHSLIRTRFPKSVWQNYDLISVQWPREPFSPKPDPKAPRVLPSGQPRPRIVANTTMESYQQLKWSDGGYGMTPGSGADQGAETLEPINFPDKGKSSCIGCHRMAATTPPFANHPKETWWTDYSSLFFKARLKKTR